MYYEILKIQEGKTGEEKKIRIKVWYRISG
jgi:hypothetical protein